MSYDDMLEALGWLKKDASPGAVRGLVCDVVACLNDLSLADRDLVVAALVAADATEDEADGASSSDCSKCPTCVVKVAAGTMCARLGCKGRPDSGAHLLLCSGCRRLSCCSTSTDCISADWRRHKPACRAVQTGPFKLPLN